MANGNGCYGGPNNRYKQQDSLVDVQAVYDFATTYGNVAINKAYCNWQCIVEKMDKTGWLTTLQCVDIVRFTMRY